MTRNMYGATSADFTLTSGGRVIPGAVLTLWTSRTGGTQIADLLDVDSVATTTVTSAADGSVVYYGPDGDNELHWADSGQGSRVAIRPTVTDIMDLSIQDEDIAADADIDRSKIAGTALTSASMAVFNVKDYGATGDGVTDDTAALEAAILAAGVGGKVLFPRGAFKVSRTLWPLFGQIWEGVHSPMYANTVDPQSTCKIVAAPGFTGRALIERAASVNAVTLYRLCLQGLGDEHATPLDGVHLGDQSWEQSWTLHTLTIHGFSGSGVTGRLYVFDMRDCHVARNGYGLRVTGNNAVTDVRIYGCQFYFNVHGGFCLDNDKHNGQVMLHGCRFERTGSTPGDPAVNRDPYGVGVRLRRGTNMDLVQCSTDANSGPGLEVTGDSANSIYTYGITISDCKFARDGGGDQSAGTRLPGVKIKGADAVFFSSNVTWGEADDSGDGSGLISPYYSVWLENTSGCRVVNSFITAPVASESLHLEGTNYSLVTDQGAAYQDLIGTALQNKETRYRISDPATGETVTRWVAGVNPTAAGGTWSVQRYDSVGAYVDSPININWVTGLIETNRLYTRAKAANQIPAEFRSFDQSPTVSLFKVALGDGSPKFEVLWDGTLRSNWGSSGYRMTQLGSTQIVREGATGSQTLIGAYTSVADANDGSPVFEVQADGSVWSDYVLGSGDGGKYLTPKAYVDAIKTSLKAEVAASTDFADFQSRIASW